MPLIVNGETIDDSVVRDEIAALRPRYQEMVQHEDPIQAEMQLKEWSRENVIERVLLRQEAAKDETAVPEDQIQSELDRLQSQSSGQAGCELPSLDALRQEVEIRLKVERLMAKIGERVAPPRPKDVSEYYRKNKDRFFAPAMIHASHIVKNVDEEQDEETARTKAEEVLAELNNGADFAAMARQHSDCPGNGDLGWFPRGQMVEEFDDVVFGLQPGQTSAVFRSPFGFHVARVTGLKPEGVRPLEEVREEIESTLFAEKRQKALEDFLDRLRAKAEVQVVRGGSK